jgi:hypothetical protein
MKEEADLENSILNSTTGSNDEKKQSYNFKQPQS